MRWLVFAHVALGLLALSSPTSAQAQASADVPAPPAPGVSVARDAEPSLDIDWPPPPSEGLGGILDPAYGYEPDDGLVWNGAMFFVAFYFNGILTTAPFAAIGCCTDPTFVAFSFVPFAQWAAGFGGNFVGLIGGSIFSILEVAAAILFLAGIFHHREALHPGRRAAGDVTLGRDGVEVAF